MVPARELSRPVTVDPWPEGGIDLEVLASEAECTALARRLDIVAVHALAGHARFEREQEGGTRLVLRLEAEVVQRCVVSLEPVTQHVVETIERRYLPARVIPASVGRREVVIDALEAEEPEPLEGGMVDVGEVMSEELALALDPYPRAADADAPVPPRLEGVVEVDLRDRPGGEGEDT